MSPSNANSLDRKTGRFGFFTQIAIFKFLSQLVVTKGLTLKAPNVFLCYSNVVSLLLFIFKWKQISKDNNPIARPLRILTGIDRGI